MELGDPATLPPPHVLQYECCMGQFPFDAQNEGALIRKILKGAYAPIVGQYTANLVSNTIIGVVILCG